ncbi:lysophospholipid acyltransferase family protein [Reyranella sp.]|uniref:lysophospholipid acyltransferase family protein n=1 Tax=Reyranella sp. TaxID=1929291 RepID=UPI002F95D3F7
MDESGFSAPEDVLASRHYATKSALTSMSGPALWLRSLCFNVGWYAGSVLIALGGAPILLLPRRAVVVWAQVWITFILWWLRVTCRLSHRVLGRENLPEGPVIIACKHQSTWETLAFTLLFSDIAIVLKRELLFIPVIGWAMARAGNIAVSRGEGASALRRLVRQAKAVVADGRSIVIFPEGTRVAPGGQKPYQAGTAALYRQLGLPVVPVALDSGVFWGRREFVKRPGVITMEVLPPIPPGLGRGPFMALLREHIETATARLVDNAEKTGTKKEH